MPETEHNWANESQNTTAPIKRRMAPITRPGRLSPEFRADLVALAADRIQAVWDDVGPTDAQTLAENVVMAQEFTWLAHQFPVSAPTPVPTTNEGDTP